MDLLQWPAMLVTLLAAWLVASTRPWRRLVGFWTFLASNVMWVAWGWHAGAYALIALQVGLAVLNIRGAVKNNDDTHTK
ncbi:hypothetical protein [Hydrogenophaga sp.]|uniref:hypothetical protein n=1 Tax=Hydrogenophaga sp. TaxID=1904254 RepID=UPI003F6FB5DF